MSELAAGQIIETFRITRRIAEGAMGEVYLAVDEQLGRRVALKFIKTGMLDARAIERFREEARTTARFNHPHIVTVYAAGVYRGRAWLALEFLDGQTLRERLDEGPLSSMEAMRVARAIAAALAEAHAHEVVHADLKPENVLIPRDGRVRVVDFGLARLVASRALARERPRTWPPSAGRASRHNRRSTCGRSACCCMRCSKVVGHSTKRVWRGLRTHLSPWCWGPA
jgi:eukaryotic-like serine/threonine-protein kinase